MKKDAWQRAAFYPILDETRVFTVSHLNAQIKVLLESNYRFIWVRGEISNLRMPASGHCYFTLKDDGSQIRSVLFKTQQRTLRFVPEDGLEVLCQGRISVYEPRGEYQLIVEVMEPRGVGALQLAFDQLKKKLEAEGLFDPALKLPMPSFPQNIAIITSATGAAIHDMLKVLRRSPCPLNISLLPVRVQGVEAAAEIAAAINTADGSADEFGWDVLIVGRGGGSIEDLWPFNEEIVARAIVNCSVPIISAVGHEIDFTISDLVADLRAPTPTAAGEWIVAQLEKFGREICKYLENLQLRISQKIATLRQRLDGSEKRLVDPRKRLQDLHLYVDERLWRMELAWRRHLEKSFIHHQHLYEKLCFYNPQHSIHRYRSLLQERLRAMVLHQRNILHRHRFQLQKASVQLQSLNPLEVLTRGYSIVYRLPDQTVLRASGDIEVGQQVKVQLARGILKCRVEKVEEDALHSPQGRIGHDQEEE
jgi:exodeoxyribonuclease VII large subunit